MIENVRKINSQQIITNTKSLLIKKYEGGRLKIEKQKIDLYTLDIQKPDILKIELNNIMDIKLKFIKDKNYIEILNYIHKIMNKIFKLQSHFYEDEYKNVEEITKQNPILHLFH
jgi:hypothetical protein